MDFYASSGHDYVFELGIPQTLDDVIGQEKSYPNATVDATRIMNTISTLLTFNSNTRSLLDIGCGYGFFSREALKQGFDVTALEVAVNERRIAETMTGLKPVPASFEEFEAPQESYDVILMSQVLEHVLDINWWVSRAHDLLRVSGILVIALPNFGSIFRIFLQENDPYICPPAHLNFFSPNCLSLLLEKHGFRMRTVQWVSRIPHTALTKRLPRLGSLTVADFSVKTLLKVFDKLHLGMMINVYADK